MGSLVGGFNPFEKYARQIGNLPQFSGWKFQKYLSWNHQPETVVDSFSVKKHLTQSPKRPRNHIGAASLMWIPDTSSADKAGRIPEGTRAVISLDHTLGHERLVVSMSISGERRFFGIFCKRFHAKLHDVCYYEPQNSDQIQNLTSCWLP